MDNHFFTRGELLFSFPIEESSYHISDDLYDEALSLDADKMILEITNSYKFSGRYWGWRIGINVYRHSWKSMVDGGEMRMDAPGFKYLKMYPTLKAMEEEHENLHPDKVGITTRPSAYYAFANYLRKGDVIIAYYQNEIVGWGMIEGNYIYRPTRKYGNHYRMASWHIINMPLIFVVKRAALYQIPAEQTHLLKETLIGKLASIENNLPLPFTAYEK